MWFFKSKNNSLKLLASDIIEQLEKWFSPSLALENDPIGLQLGKNKQISKILIALDTTKEVVDYAINKKIDLIINHHPFIYKTLEEEKLNPVKSKLINKINSHNIIVYNCHTNYDSANNGMNDYICEKLNFKNVKINPINHLMRLITLSDKILLEQLMNIIKEKLSIKNILFSGDLNNKIKNIALLAGSGSDVISTLDNNVDLFITGELKWHDWLQADQQQVSVLALGHYMENVFVEHLYQLLNEKFKQLEIFILNINNPIQFR